MKTCSKCKQEYPATLEYFHKKKNNLRSHCKSCHIKNVAEWQKNNPKKANKTKYVWSQRNPEYKHQWYENNKEKAYAANRRRKANLKNVISEPYTDQQILDKYGHNCYLCQEPIDFTVPRTEPKGFQVEHVIAISKGGPDTLENVRPSHAYCNWSKGSKSLQDLSKS